MKAISDSQAGISNLPKTPPQPAPEYLKELDQ